MATVIGVALASLASWLLLWVVVMIFYLGCVAAVDHLKAKWWQHQRVRQYKRAVAAEMARIDLAASASVQRIGSAFMVAQQLARNRPRER
jgi:hypothetical protein